MTRLFDIKPWELEKLTYLEISYYRGELDDRARAARIEASKQQSPPPKRAVPRRRR